MNRRPICWMLIGLPASGKSYFRRTMRGQVLSTDDYIHDYAQQNNRTYSEVFKEAIPAAEAKMKDDLATAIEENWDIIWDQTNLTKNSRARKLQQLPDYYKKIAVYIVTPNKEEWEDRLARRTFQPIPQNVLRSMQKQIEFPTKDEGFDEIQVLDWNHPKEHWC